MGATSQGLEILTAPAEGSQVGEGRGASRAEDRDRTGRGEDWPQNEVIRGWGGVVTGGAPQAEEGYFKVEETRVWF